ncbi:cupin-like domain-containing protein [Archangium gephyra]|uniref:cupin-like domain-containing protein n=1 Tax=Archangium gephyra TaxID=48 RepID=UPI0035D47564
MRLPPLPFETKPVRRLHRPSPQELWAQQEPVVLTGCMDDWKLLHELKARATPEQKLAVLGSRFGTQTVEYHRLPGHLGGHYHFQKENLEGVTFSGPQAGVTFDTFAGELLRSLSGASSDYVYLQSHAVEPGTALFEALGPNVLPVLHEQQVFPKLWVGSPGQVVNLHYDDFINFICMLEGTKRVTLFAPELLPFMYHAPFDRMLNQAMASHVRLLEPDLESFPLFRQALSEARVAVLEPGEVLFTPPFWWHHVESFGLNVMINNWLFREHLDEVVEMQGDLTQAIRLFHARPAGQRDRARALYQRTVFAPGAASAPEPAGSTEQEEPGLAEHRARTRALVARLPEALRKQHALYYDHFVFQTSGEPFPSQPGALTAMVERNAHAPTFFLRD